MASAILLIISVGIVPLVTLATTTNNRNRVESTAAMLANGIVEHMRSTIVGGETSSLRDCVGSSWPVTTGPGGSPVNGAAIDFTKSPPADYHMDYVVNSPCSATGKEAAVYDVRWRVDVVGAPSTPTNTYLVTVGVRQKQVQVKSVVISPINLRVMIGN